ncbi:MAG: ankyrin repeat domain-containing protein, partial [Planctomycetota bacterium]
MSLSISLSSGYSVRVMRWLQTVAVLSVVGLLASCSIEPLAPEPAVAPVQTLFDAARDGDADLAASLIRQDADVNATDEERLTPLHVAAFGGQADIIRLLVSAGADVGARDMFGFTPLHAAARDGQLAAVQTLVAGGAEVNATDNDGSTAVQVALFMRQQDVVDYLYAHGAICVEEPAPTAVVAVPKPGVAPAIVRTGANVRAWTSASGDQIEAEFVQCVMDVVTLRRNDGTLVRVPLNRLSPADQVAVRQLAGTVPPVLSRRRAARKEKP